MSGIGYDVATALWQGARPYQEDTILADFHGGMGRGFAVLADGMGGHAAGDLASRLVVIDAASHLKFLMHDGEALERSLKAELTSAIETANDVLKDRAGEDTRLHGMGTTFLATVLFEDRLYWASVGDSPLYLWREGELRQINEDHSMAPVIDQMARTGEISAEDAVNHPDRNALTSVLMGQRIKALDVPETATVLDPGDVLIQASDGVQYLDDTALSAVLAEMPVGASSRSIADHLMAALQDLNDPNQDNTALMVLQLTQDTGVGVHVKDRAGQAASSVAPARAVDTTMPIAERMAGPETDAAATPSIRATGAAASTPNDSTRGGRRWLAPAAIVAALAVGGGFLFGLPNGDGITDVATVVPPTPLPQFGTTETSSLISGVTSGVPSNAGGAGFSTGVAPASPVPSVAAAAPPPPPPEPVGVVGATTAVAETPVIASDQPVAAPEEVVEVLTTGLAGLDVPLEDKLAQPRAESAAAATIAFGEEIAPEVAPLSEGLSEPTPVGDQPIVVQPAAPRPPARPTRIIDPTTGGAGITNPIPAPQSQRGIPFPHGPSTTDNTLFQNIFDAPKSALSGGVPDAQ